MKNSHTKTSRHKIGNTETGTHIVNQQTQKQTLA